MTTSVDTTWFVRTAGLLWRDTGRHVLVLGHDEARDVTVLGGGGATLWRLLDRPRSLDELEQRLAGAPGQPHLRTDLAACLEDLAERGLLQRGAGE